MPTSCTHTLDEADEVPCPGCHGAGERHSPGQEGDYRFPCRTCHGCGVVPRMVDCLRCQSGRECDHCGCTGKVPAAKGVIEVARLMRGYGWRPVAWGDNPNFAVGFDTHDACLRAAREARG